MSTARLVVLTLVLSLCMLAQSAPALADTVYDLNVPGIGNLIPVESFTISGNQLTVTRQPDGFSQAIFIATIIGEDFAAGSLDTYNTSFSTTTPITSFLMTDIIFTSFQHSGTSENPIEMDSLQFQTGAFVTQTPEPASLLLLGSGLVGLIGIKRVRRIGS